MIVPLLRARGIRKVLGGQVILDDVGFDLAEGELAAVVGPNGAGKTTLLRLLTGVIRPDSGDVELFGQRLERWARREIAGRVAVVPQDLRVDFPYRVVEMVEMGRAPHLGPFGHAGPRDREIVREALAELDLTVLAERLFPSLSGGERQRVALARARAQETPVLLLDEPTAHMDLGRRLQTFEWLRDWVGRSADRAALLVTHDLELVARFADRIVLLGGEGSLGGRGRILADGPPAAILTPEAIRDVYRVDARVRQTEAGTTEIVALRSRID